MADIELTCHRCRLGIILSEFIEPDRMACPSCGVSLDWAAAVHVAVPKPKIALQQSEIGAKPDTLPVAGSGQRSRPADQEGASASKQVEYPVLPEHLRAEAQAMRQAGERRRRRSSRARGQKASTAWLLFIALGLTTGALKYGGFLPDLFESVRDSYGFPIAVALYVVLALKAFEDSAFTGVMCIIFPPYGLYYLFTLCDNFLLRATVAGMLVGFGQDIALSTRDNLYSAYRNAYNWVSSQGGEDVVERIDRKGK